MRIVVKKKAKDHLHDIILSDKVVDQSCTWGGKKSTQPSYVHKVPSHVMIMKTLGMPSVIFRLS